MITQAGQIRSENPLFPTEEQPGKFQRFCNWAKAHKKGIAIALLIIGIACATFGAGAILSLIPLTSFSTIQLAGFFFSLFSFHGLVLAGMSSKGILFLTGVGSFILGSSLACFGGGILAGLPSAGKATTFL